MRKKPTIADAKQIAIKREGECLSSTLCGTSDILQWKCKNGHIWKARYSSVKTGRWCRKCSVNKKRSTELERLISDRGGVMLGRYKNNATPVKCQCQNGHIWYPCLINIQKGKWCSKCAGNSKLSLEEMKVLARRRGGKCLSNIYVNNHSKLDWECFNGHKWSAMPANIVKGNWCPECCSFFGERVCREILQQLTGYKFEKCRPNWLNGLELDGYCKSKGVAFEYDGLYHKQVIFSFHSEKDLLNIKKRDFTKTELCSKYGVTLIRIDEPRPFSIEKVRSQIITELSASNIPFNNVDIDIELIYTNKF